MASTTTVSGKVNRQGALTTEGDPRITRKEEAYSIGNNFGLN